MSKTLPTRLYKYQAYKEESIENLKKNCVWFSKPAAFNDPFDCSISYLLDNINQRTWKILGKHLSNYRAKDTDEERKNRTAVFFQDATIRLEARNTLTEILKKRVRQGLEDDFQNSGIACFTEKPDNIIMWSHYANGHKGFCLGFDTTSEPFSQAEEVRYSKKLSTFKLKDDLEFDLSKEIALTKSKGWLYEKEWRVKRDGGDVEINYESASLSGIYFGWVMPESHKDLISSILSTTPTRIYQMKRNEKEFKISYEPYTRK